MSTVANEKLPEVHVLRRGSRTNAAIGLLIVMCLACDFLMIPIITSVAGPPKLPGFVVAVGVVACVLAQGSLLAAWLAWSEGPFVTRLVRHWLIAALLYLLWVAGFGLSQVSQFAEITTNVGLCVPLVSIAAQTPLWIARQYFGWRLVRSDAGVPSDSRSSLTIRDLMVATLVAACSFGVARLARFDPGDQSFVWAFAFVVASGLTAMAILPAGALLLGALRLDRGLVFTGLYAASLVAFLWLGAFVVRFKGWFALPPLPFFVGLSSVILSYAITVILVAVAARARGYRLVWGRRPLPH